ncbi:MAG: type II toxin-antitoxin system RelE/ParE family toxin [Fusobacteriaceae bacterium]|jgi:proteic killer suppression protein|nr:type II toxin-antitoxin system RelE/ParE family toxin [Fusobacteriaceae bacterium]
MIKSFSDKHTERLFKLGRSKKYSKELCEQALRKLFMLDKAVSEEILRKIPGNHYEKLQGRRKGESSIKINDQWRLAFRWFNGNAYEVEIVDYH